MLNKSLWTAIVTPFDAAGRSIDFKSLEKLLKLQKAAENGVILLGSTGEGLSLSDEERRQIIGFAFNLKLKIPLISGVPSHNFIAALEWIEFCNQFPLDGYLMTTPIYTKPGVLGQTQWFEKLMQASQHQCMLYNIPSRAGIKLHAETVRNLCTNKKFAAIKDSSGTVDSLVEYKMVAPNIAVYCGDDYLMPVMSTESAQGLISVASNVWPTATHKYVQLCLEGVRLDSKLWWQACKALFTASNPIPVKALLHHLGLISHAAVRLPLSLNDLKSINELTLVNQLIINWEKQYAL
ncbi:MAG: 4-hydroxy-tetrahydrodipicolinate synthase [Candidatus Midichloria sp.]|uniref:4-hydroxy-2-oxoglutarate aldolase, mitochondrial n=1 Tax=Hyalomma marginatum TaxID=34627 RepID=A0A8S4C2U8_9ACAR|nr:4-hydroxy-tetrahydrodipicolinate synthase [Hyalomma marginatum]CAG7600297.1 4-hydroxy-tetrahydrodipicolinate synthase [Hyalomma marginatum]